MTEMILTGAVLAVGLLLADNIVPLLFARRKRGRRGVATTLQATLKRSSGLATLRPPRLRTCV